MKSKLPGVVSAILIQYRDFKEGYLVPIQLLQQIKDTGKKSINIEMARKYGMPLNLIYKRTRCSINEFEFKNNFLEYQTPEYMEE